MAEIRKYKTLEAVRAAFLPNKTFEQLDGEQTMETVRRELTSVLTFVRRRNCKVGRQAETNK